MPRPGAPAAAGPRAAAIIAAVVALCAAVVSGAPAWAQGPPMGSPGAPPSGAPPTSAPPPGTAPSTSAPAFRPTATSVRFFETPYAMRPREARGYTTWFSKAQARFIGWQLDLTHPAPGRRVDFTIEQVWTRDDGTIVARQSLRTHVDASWGSSYHHQSWGWRNPGNWRGGSYRVDFFLGGQRLASGSFKIFNPSAAAASAFNRGVATMRAKRHREAIAYFDRAIGYHADFASAYTNRCFLRAYLGEYEAALLDCSRALELNPGDSRAYYDRGTIHVARSRYAAAIADLTRSIALDPEDAAAAYSNRAAAYHGAGEHDKAWADVRRAQGLGYAVPPSLIEKLERATARSR